jgi:hypothetical protein
LSFLVPPVGLAVGIYLLLKGSDRSKPWAKVCLLCALGGVVAIGGLLLVRGLIPS